MTIKEIQALLKTDFVVYKNTLLANQEALINKLNEEKIFISALDVETLSTKIEKMAELPAHEYPLLGVPFAVKDNIDVEGFVTTAGCKEYGYMPEESAFVVKQLEAAGAICIGKTNLDQFATGLVGTRSPFGVAKNYFNEEYIPGGSSSGSASSLTAGYAAFSLGTDTAGSGRVPAAFQNLVGVKPTRGIVSNSGVVPACKSLDCVSVFATNLEDAEAALSVMSAYDETEPYSRENIQEHPSAVKSIAIPLKSNLKFFGNSAYEKAFYDLVESMIAKGYEVKELDFSPLFDAAKLLYDGPWVAERYHAVGEFIENNKEAVLPTTCKIILGGKEPTACSYFDAEYKLRAFKKVFDKYATEFAAFLMPTAGTIYKVKEIEKEPVLLNSNLGYYTNFMNLLDCAALALPVTITDENLPFGATIFAPAFNDVNLLKIGQGMAKMGLLNIKTETTDFIDLAVCGAHKRGGVLNYQLTEINAVYSDTLLTSADYRFYALEELNPVRPGLVKVAENGAKIEVEVWKVPTNALGQFINNIAAPLTFGKVTLETGEVVTSFLCESYAVAKAKDITDLQRWENYLEL